MTALLERALEAARLLPAEEQDEIARLVLALAEGRQEAAFEAPDDARFAQSLHEAATGQFASEEEVRAVWAKHGL